MKTVKRKIGLQKVQVRRSFTVKDILRSEFLEKTAPKRLYMGHRRFATPKFWLPLIFIILYYAGNLLVDELATRATHFFHPELVYNSEGFFAFLGTNPWEFTAVRILWIAVLFLALYLFGMRFLSPCKNADRKEPYEMASPRDGLHSARSACRNHCDSYERRFLFVVDFQELQ
ncbi:MAG: hypothetical protein ACFN3H_04205 [Spirochaetales bacterium]